MAAHRAQWKGFLKAGEVSCGIALYTAASTSDRINFNTINKATGHRVNRVFIDSNTEKVVPREQQMKALRSIMVTMSSLTQMRSQLLFPIATRPWKSKRL